ncbi:MAG: hypothetical protein ACTHQQ_02340 [Solirubrobacteraceae bacterium]
MKRSPAVALRSSIAAMSRSRAAVFGVALLFAGGGVAYASGTGRDSPRATGSAIAATNAGHTRARRVVVRVAHGPVTARNSQYIDAPPAGPSVGDVRTYYLPLTRSGSSRKIGYLTGTLTTTATGRPKPGMELRTANLVFVLGRVKNQLVVGGVAAYAQSAPVLAKRSVVTRPVVGGSGRYAGARGWCVSTHLANNTWTHVFHLTLDR